MRRFLMCGVSTMCLLLLAGCGGKKDGPAPRAKPTDTDEHNHAEVGPHKGLIVEIHEGDKEAYHAELVHDDATHTFMLYLLDIKVEKAVPVEQKEIVLKLKEGDVPIQFTLLATPQEGEKEGQSSRFQVVDEKLCALYNKKGVTGSFAIVIDGKPHIPTYNAAGEEEHAGK